MSTDTRARNPYSASRKYNPDGYWADSFARGGNIVWLVFCGDDMLAAVRNEQQAENLLRHLTKTQETSQ